MSREYELVLSCGCQISLEGGGGQLPCYKDECMFEEEYLLSPQYPDWCVETFKRNNIHCSDLDIAVVRTEAENRQQALKKGLDDTTEHQVKGWISENDERYF